MNCFCKPANKTSQNLLTPLLILTNAGAVAFPPKWCHFPCDDVITELALVKGISSQKTKIKGNFIGMHKQLQQNYHEICLV